MIQTKPDVIQKRNRFCWYGSYWRDADIRRSGEVRKAPIATSRCFCLR